MGYELCVGFFFVYVPVIIRVIDIFIQMHMRSETFETRFSLAYVVSTAGNSVFSVLLHAL